MTNAGHRALGIVLAGALLAACGKKEKVFEADGHGGLAVPAPKLPVQKATPSTPQAPATSRPPNHKGVAFVPEYHHVAIGKTSYHRSPDAFRKDLERLDKIGFRPVTARDWLAGKMNLAKGATPAVMTFDDADGDQFKLLDDGTVDPNCAVGIWLAFAKIHPEFPVRATFFVLPTMWEQPKWVQKKLEMLRGWGCEVANHTITHVALRHQTDERVKKEIGDAAIALAKLGENGPFDLAYPLGSTPKNLAMLKGFPYKSGRITVASGFLVGADPAPMPDSPKFSLYKIPRIQATTGPFGLDDWLDKTERGKVKLYVE